MVLRAGICTNSLCHFQTASIPVLVYEIVMTLGRFFPPGLNRKKAVQLTALKNLLSILYVATVAVKLLDAVVRRWEL